LGYHSRPHPFQGGQEADRREGRDGYERAGQPGPELGQAAA